MSNAENHPDGGNAAIFDAIRRLEERIARLESHLGLAPPPVAPPEASLRLSDLHSAREISNEGLEQRVGEFGLAWGGSIVLLFGIVFLMAYAISRGYGLLSALIGYAAVVVLYFTARFWKVNIPHLSRILDTISLLLLYYTTVRLHYFTATPLVHDASVSITLLIAVVAFQFILSMARSSQSLASIALLLGMLSGLLADAPHITLPLTAALSAAAVYLAVRRGWWRLLSFTVVLAYASHLLWLLNDPIMGRPLGAIPGHHFNIVYLFIYAAVFSWPALSSRSESPAEETLLAVTALNLLGFSSVLGLAVMAHFRQSYQGIFLGVAGFLLLLAILAWLKGRGQFIPAAYACFGYMGLSIAIYGYAGLPFAFFWLSLQSFLVVSMALWFRSRILVVANFLIFLGILLFYWIGSPGSDLADFSFAFVALGSARVMNWQKERLALRTESLRNVYLFVTFVLVLVALHNAVPRRYVSLSWTGAAAAYFTLSILLHNIKYRWMAIMTMAATVGYLFFVDLARLDPEFRVAAFLILGLTALGISLFYTRLRKSGDNKET